jgi:molybdate transport system substrate-binding protein
MPAPLRLLSAGSIRRGVTSIIQLFERRSGASVDADFSSAPKVRARLMADEAADVIIASAEALDVLAGAGKIRSDSRTLIGRTGMAVAAREGAVVSDLTTKTTFRQTMLAADLIAYNQGSSGLHAAALIDALGLREPLGEKIRVVQNGAEMFRLITMTPGRIYGLANITNIVDEIDKGSPVMLAALLPAEIQNVTTYEAAVASASLQPALADDFVNLFASDEGRKQLAAAGLETG